MKRHWPLIAIASGILLFIGGFAYDAIFAGIPHQDPTPELSDRYAFHSSIARTFYWSGVGIFILGIAGGVTRIFCRRK